MKSRLLVIVLAISSILNAADKPSLPLPDPGDVTLTLDEYNKLVELAAKPVKIIETPPLPYSLKHAELKLHVENESVMGAVQLEGEVFRKGMTKIPITTGITLLDAHHEGGKGVPLQQENGTQAAVLPGPAEFSIAIDAAIPLRIDAGRASLLLPAPLAGSVQLALVIPGDHTYVNVSPGVITNRKSENGRTAIQATLVPGQSTNIWWTTREGMPNVAREVRFLSDVKTLISVSEAELKVAALADITVVQGQPSQFEVEVPPGYEITGVTGASLDSSEMQSGVLTLKLGGTSQRSHQFLITMERSITGSKTDAAFLSFKGAQRETGEVMVDGAGTIQLTGTEGGSLKRMDVKETNPYLRSLAHFPPQAAFRYHKQPSEAPTLALEWVRFPDSSVLAAVAEHAVVTTLVTSEGKSLTEVKLTLKNQAQPFLKVGLPTGASILSADVAGEKVKPVQGPDGNRIPLLRPGFRATGSYEVSFVFMHAGDPFSKKGGSELSLPQMDIPISLLDWEVFLPERYKVKDFGGDVISANLVPTAFREGEQPPMEERNVNALMNLESLLPGQLGGYIVDPSGAVISNARVTVVHPDTGVTMSTVTDQNGRWLMINQQSGRVRIAVDSPGFKRIIREVSYDANQPQQYSFTLNVGATTTTVEVMAEAADLQSKDKMYRNEKKQAQAAQQGASTNVINLQRRVAGVLPVAIDVPRAGTSFRFVRPLVLDEETKVTFRYRSK